MAVPCREIVDNAVYISPTFPPRHSPDTGVRKPLFICVPLTISAMERYQRLHGHDVDSSRR